MNRDVDLNDINSAMAYLSRHWKFIKLQALTATMPDYSLKQTLVSLESKLKQWKRTIDDLEINRDSENPAGGQYYYFQQATTFTEDISNLEALENVVYALKTIYEWSKHR